ncbi:PAS domain-containing sensor histidine kinase [Magnetospira sp. QH-2]|uniref:PAS domain-containing sensor histidine kinase n=1 Tax=Magnetospira sp. (strain QH-2) TaxID=1288970 RepID=UPI0003E81966|nr:ATP-binding protein [Magnetospira sp. QH-2]CCQ73888.1 Putative histidine kinase with PAS domain [Magnetospira sp. QH-2]
MKIRPDSKLLIGTAISIAVAATVIWAVLSWITGQRELKQELEMVAKQVAPPIDILFDETMTHLSTLSKIETQSDLYAYGGRPDRLAGYSPEVVLGIYTPMGRHLLSSAPLFDQAPTPLLEAFQSASKSKNDVLQQIAAWNGKTYVAVVRPQVTEDGTVERFQVYSFSSDRLRGWIRNLDLGPHIVARILTPNGNALLQEPDRATLNPRIEVSHGLNNFHLRLTFTADEAGLWDFWVRHKLSELVPMALVILIAGSVIFFMIKLYGREFRHQQEATALRQSHMAQREQDRQRLVDAVDSLSEGFALWDADDRLVLGNTPLDHYFPSEVVGNAVGQTFEELYGKIIDSGYIPSARPDPEGWLRNRVRGHRNPSGSYEVRLSNGRWVRITERRTREGGIAATYMDITLEKVAAERIRKEKETAETYLAIAGTIILALDALGRVTLINRKGCEILGRPEIEIVGQNWWDLALPTAERTRVWEMFSSVMAREIDLPDYFENEIVTKNGERRLVAWHNAIIPDKEGRPAGTLSSGEDISDRKKTEVALRNAMQAAELANRAKTEFLATMSHELRTPLNSIIGFSDILSNEMFGPLGQPDYRQYATDINESGKHLLDLINDILDIARIESGGMVLREGDIDVQRLLQSALRMVQERAQQAGLTLEKVDVLPTPAPILHGDERRIKQVLINLLFNSIKFTPVGGTITLATGLDRESRFYFRVTDTGIGIAAEDLDRVLSPFGQADSSFSRQYEGAGLGLPLSRNLVELHDGTLVLDSSPGEGTSVSLRFPAARTTFLPAPE